MRPVGLKQQRKQIESCCDSQRQQRRQRQTQQPRQLQSNLFHRQVICLQKQMFCNLLTRKFLCVFCVLALFAVARFLRPPQHLFTLFVLLFRLLSTRYWVSLSLSRSLSLCSTSCLAPSYSLALFLSGSCFANENCTRMLPK